MSDAIEIVKCEHCDIEHYEGKCKYCRERFSSRWATRRFCKKQCAIDYNNNLRQPKTPPSKISLKNQQVVADMKARAGER